LRENKELRRRLKDYLDVVIKRDLSQFPDDGIPPNVDTSQKASNSPPLDPFVEDECVLQRACRYRIRKGIKEYQYHCCTATCQKGNFGGCRLRMPKSTRDKSVYDFKSGLLLLKQVDDYVNNFNLWLTLIVNSNTDIQFVLNTNSTASIVFYITNYVTKSMEVVDNFYVLSKAAYEDLLKKPMHTMATGYTEDQHRVRSLLVRMNSLMRKSVQISANMVCTYLLGLPMMYKNLRYDTLTNCTSAPPFLGGNLGADEPRWWLITPNASFQGMVVSKIALNFGEWESG
jgi:hypothetical protein